jgi:hypothetical protein
VIATEVMQRRYAVRFSLNLPVIFRWDDRRMMKHERLGHTRDLSLSALFVLCSAPLSVGTVVDLEVCLPPLEENKFQRLRLEGTGEVIRVGGEKEPSGFAAITDFVLLEAED